MNVICVIFQFGTFNSQKMIQYFMFIYFFVNLACSLCLQEKAIKAQEEQVKQQKEKAEADRQRQVEERKRLGLLEL